MPGRVGKWRDAPQGHPWPYPKSPVLLLPPVAGLSASPSDSALLPIFLPAGTCEAKLVRSVLSYKAQPISNTLNDRSTDLHIERLAGGALRSVALFLEQCSRLFGLFELNNFKMEV
jgi:hypothetical protein